MSARQGTKLVVALLVAGLMIAFLFPVAIGAISGPEELTATQDNGSTVTLQDDLNATVDSTTDATSATYTITGGNDSVTTTVNVGANETVTVNGADVTISPTEATATGATTDYEFPTTYGWGTGAASLWSILPIMLVLAVFLFVTYMALKQT